MAKIIIGGYYGFKNAGDEAVLSGIITRLGTELPEAELVALSSDPPHTMKTHGISAVSRTSVFDLWQTVRQADLLLLGGGGLLQDITSRRSLWYYLGLLTLARRCGKPAVTYGLGVGPLGHGDSRALVRSVLRRASGIAVRDEGSRDELTRCGIPSHRIHVTGDASMAMTPPTPAEMDEAAARLSALAPGPYLGIALRPWGGERWMPGLAAAVQDVASRMGATVVAFSMMPDDDLPVAQRFAHMVGGGAVAFPVEDRPGKLAALIGCCRGVVAMRLHALVFACLAGRSAVGLEYDPKVGRFTRRVGCPSMAPTEANAASLLRALSEFDRAGIAQNIARLREAERGNAAMVREVLKGGGGQ